MRTANRLRAAAICLVYAALLSCSSGDGVSEIRLIDGRTIGDAVSAEGISVVLVYSPDSCFSCAGILGRWVQLDRDATGLQVALILTSEPDEREKRDLALRRVPVAGVVLNPDDVPTDPVAYVFEDLALTDLAVGLNNQASLLRDLSSRVLK